MIRFILAAALSLTTANAAPLSPAKATALREQFQTRQSQTKTWSASLTQTLAMPGMRQPVVSTGTLVYRSPGQLRLDFTKPEGEFVLVTGDQVFLQKAGKSLSTKSLADDRVGKPFASLLGLLRGQPTETEEQYTFEISRVAENYVLVLTKKDDAPRSAPKRITNTIDADSLEVREVLVELPNNGTLTYTFTNPARNRPVRDEVFAIPTAGR